MNRAIHKRDAPALYKHSRPASSSVKRKKEMGAGATLVHTHVDLQDNSLDFFARVCRSTSFYRLCVDILIDKVASCADSPCRLFRISTRGFHLRDYIWFVQSFSLERMWFICLLTGIGVGEKRLVGAVSCQILRRWLWSVKMHRWHNFFIMRLVGAELGGCSHGAATL